MDAIPGRRWSHDWHYLSAAGNDVESAARHVGFGTRRLSAQQFLRRCSSEVAHALEVNDPNGIVCRSDGWIHPVEHSCGNDEHRDSVRVRDRLRRGAGDAQDESQCESPLPCPLRSPGSDSRNCYVSAADVLAALRELGPSYRLAPDRISDLLRVWSPSQRDVAPYGT